jgi:ethanolamine ammonia-lyase small subunit
MSTVLAQEVRSIVAAVLAELSAQEAHLGLETPAVALTPSQVSVPSAPPQALAPSAPQQVSMPSAPPKAPTARPLPPKPDEAVAASSIGGEVSIEVSDPTMPAERRRIGVKNPANASGLANLAASTSARIAVGRAGPRPTTRAVLLFGADHAVTQDAIFGDVPTELLDKLGLFTVQTKVTSQDEFLLRPDLGRMLDDEAKKLLSERCVKKPQVQIVIGDGLSAAAVTNNLPQIYPVIEQGLKGAGLSLGTPFFVRYCRVGVMNDINDIVQADVVALLIGERPGLGVADALSVYSGWRPTAGKTDAHRDVICMITENGGTNPLEAGAFVVEHIKTVIRAQSSGIELRLEQSGER